VPGPSSSFRKAAKVIPQPTGSLYFPRQTARNQYLPGRFGTNPDSIRTGSGSNSRISKILGLKVWGEGGRGYPLETEETQLSTLTCFLVAYPCTDHD
jgi:hypothetical protein